jgi:polar amino acid transport system substrate-binding protein
LRRNFPWQCLAGMALMAAVGCGQAPGPVQKSTLDEILHRGVLRVGMNSGYKPFEVKTAAGQWEGFDVDLARELAQDMGVKLEIVETEWDPVISNLAAGKFDLILSGMTRTPRRALGCLFTEPYFKTGQVVMVNASKHPPGSLRSPLDLDRAGVVLSTRLGTTGEIAARKQFPKATIKTFDAEGEAALEVDAGRADALVYDQPFATLHAGESQGRVYVLRQTLTSEYLAAAVRRGDQELANWVNLALFEYKHGPAYAQSYRRWFGRDPDPLDF